jgi:HAE1 family hydrophobic/amphiphilic exporter-1
MLLQTTRNCRKINGASPVLSRFFIDRPIFASVISILIVLAGAISIFRLPVSEYPDITPPVIQVTASYPGANPQVVADTVAAPIEQEVNGVENMLYMSSTSATDGSYTLRVTFELGTDPDMATILVQNRVNRVMPKLPEAVQRQGVTTNKRSTSFVAVFSLYSPDKRFDDLYITNYATINIKDRIARVKGVGDVIYFPAKDYGMRIWLDPNRLQHNNLTVADILDALRQQNVQVAAGQIGQQPARQGQDIQLTVQTLGRLTETEQFEDIIVKAGDAGRITRIKDVARVEFGGKTYDTLSFFKGLPSASIVIFQSPGANALEVADSVRSAMEELKRDFPEGLDYTIVYNASEFVRASIHAVMRTLLEAFFLVSLVVFIFLQDWRATLIPAITIPVSLMGTFGVMSLMGFSINMITLFGMVLAIGIVVDDSIVVVENVERNMREHGLSPRDATIRAMGQITGAVIGITLVLMAVFIPAAFLTGITGQLYRQFSLTIAFTTLFSAINALTLSPALCALFLRPHEGKRNVLFRWFNDGFQWFTDKYSALVTICVRRLFISTGVFAIFIAITFFGLMETPSGFVPSEDDGLILVNAQLPDGASLERTKNVMQRVAEILKDTDGVRNFNLLTGWSIIDAVGANQGGGFIELTDWSDRLKRGRSKNVIMGELFGKFSRMQEAIVFPFSLPPIRGAGQSSGFELQIQDRGSLGLVALEKAANEIADAARARPEFRNVNATFRAEVPMVFAEVDRTKTMQLKVPLQNVFDTMQGSLGSTYVNDFNKFGRTWQVLVQADTDFRMKRRDIAKLQVRNRDGKMVPLGTIVHVKDTLGPQRVERYNLYPSAKVFGESVPGVSSGTSLDIVEKIAGTTLPKGMGFEWTGMAFQEKKTSGEMGIVLSLAMLVVVLILAAQYESWIDPLAVILVVPLGILGAVAALYIRNFDNNLYTQVGLVLLVGLAAKNAILIVEFARRRYAGGMSSGQAAVEASTIRLRPILMTSLAFIFGVLPLALATGAGATSRQALGTAVVGGMLGVTALGIFFTPVLYVLLKRLTDRKRASQPETV